MGSKSVNPETLALSLQTTPDNHKDVMDSPKAQHGCTQQPNPNFTVFYIFTAGIILTLSPFILYHACIIAKRISMRWQRI
jgi:hypothetical protein